VPAEGYLAGLLTGGARPFRYRAGVRRLLGLPDGPSAPIGFAVRVPSSISLPLPLPRPPGWPMPQDWGPQSIGSGEALQPEEGPSVPGVRSGFDAPSSTGSSMPKPQSGGQNLSPAASTSRDLGEAASEPAGVGRPMADPALAAARDGAITEAIELDIPGRTLSPTGTKQWPAPSLRAVSTPGSLDPPAAAESVSPSHAAMRPVDVTLPAARPGSVLEVGQAAGGHVPPDPALPSPPPLASAPDIRSSNWATPDPVSVPDPAAPGSVPPATPQPAIEPSPIAGPSTPPTASPATARRPSSVHEVPGAPAVPSAAPPAAAAVLQHRFATPRLTPIGGSVGPRLPTLRPSARGGTVADPAPPASAAPVAASRPARDLLHAGESRAGTARDAAGVRPRPLDRSPAYWQRRYLPRVPMRLLR
jgi:hypothetical protein